MAQDRAEGGGARGNLGGLLSNLGSAQRGEGSRGAVRAPGTGKPLEAAGSRGRSLRGGRRSGFQPAAREGGRRGEGAGSEGRSSRGAEEGEPKEMRQPFPPAASAAPASGARRGRPGGEAGTPRPPGSPPRSLSEAPARPQTRGAAWPLLPPAVRTGPPHPGAPRTPAHPRKCAPRPREGPGEERERGPRIQLSVSRSWSGCHVEALQPQPGAGDSPGGDGFAQQCLGGLLLCLRKPRAHRSVLCVRRVRGPGAHAGCLGDQDLLPHRLPPAAPRQVPAGPSEQQRQQRQRGRQLGHRVGHLGAEAPPLREDVEQERVHIGRGAGARATTGGARAHHQGDLDERAARGAWHPESQPLLLGPRLAATCKGTGQPGGGDRRPREPDPLLLMFWRPRTSRAPHVTRRPEVSFGVEFMET